MSRLLAEWLRMLAERLDPKRKPLSVHYWPTTYTTTNSEGVTLTWRVPKQT